MHYMAKPALSIRVFSRRLCGKAAGGRHTQGTGFHVSLSLKGWARVRVALTALTKA